MENNKFKEYVTFFRKALPIGQSFDIGERNFMIGERELYLYYVEGFVKSEILEQILFVLFSVSKNEMDQRHNASDFIKYNIPYAQAVPEKNTDNMMRSLLAGMVLMVVDGYSEVIVMDLRTYPVRSVGEPEKEKSLRGAKDGFVETILFQYQSDPEANP
jgi:stage V sporulation protein AF